MNGASPNRRGLACWRYSGRNSKSGAFSKIAESSGQNANAIQMQCEGREDTIKPQVFFPPLTLPTHLPSHLAPLAAETLVSWNPTRVRDGHGVKAWPAGAALRV